MLSRLARSGGGLATAAARALAAASAAARPPSSAATVSSGVPDVEAVVVGGGVVGLAIARQLACVEGREVLILEVGDGIGQETSSRNSEVIHAGEGWGPGPAGAATPT